MRKNLGRTFAFTVLLATVGFVWYADGIRASLYREDPTAASPLFESQLEQKIRDMERTAPGVVNDPADAEPAVRERSRQALIIFSEGASACITSGCAASGCVGSACGASGCATSACGGSGCAGSGCVGSACAGSGCGGSGCVGSGCGGSGCVSSGCGGSGCVGTGCAGSACQKCSDAVAQGEFDDGPEGMRAATHGGFCPMGSPGGSSARFASLEAVRTPGGTRVRWIVSGVEVDRYRVFLGDRESAPALVQAGEARADRLMEVLVPGTAEPSTLIVEVTDAAGLPVRAQLEVDAARPPESRS